MKQNIQDLNISQNMDAVDTYSIKVTKMVLQHPYPYPADE